MEFTRENVTQALEAIVAKAGEGYVYDHDHGRDNAIGCFYSTTDGKPSCIVGHLIHDLAPVTFAEIHKLENQYQNSCLAESVVGGTWDGWSDADGNMPENAHSLTDDEELIQAINLMQGWQDSGHSWEKALEGFRQELA